MIDMEQGTVMVIAVPRFKLEMPSEAPKLVVPLNNETNRGPVVAEKSVPVAVTRILLEAEEGVIVAVKFVV